MPVMKRLSAIGALITIAATVSTASAEMSAADCKSLKKLVYLSKNDIAKARGEFIKEDMRGRVFATRLSIPGYASCVNIIRKDDTDMLRCETDLLKNTLAFDRVGETMSCVADLLNERDLEEVWFEGAFRMLGFDADILLAEPRDRLKSPQKDYVTMTVKTKYAWKGEMAAQLWYRYR